MLFSFVVSVWLVAWCCLFCGCLCCFVLCSLVFFCFVLVSFSFVFVVIGLARRGVDCCV